LADYYDDQTSTGFKITFGSDELITKINQTEYKLTLGSMTGSASGLSEETWYGYILNIDQRNKMVEQYIYKRNVKEESQSPNLNSTELRKVYGISYSHTPTEIFTETTPFRLMACDMKITNLRLFTQIIPTNQHSLILNQSIIRDDSKYLIFADNANQRIILPNFPTGQTKYS